jgi:hypothetical protein
MPLRHLAAGEVYSIYLPFPLVPSLSFPSFPAVPSLGAPSCRDKNARSTTNIFKRKIDEIDANGDGVIDEAKLTRAVEEMLRKAQVRVGRWAGGWNKMLGAEQQ